jgi:DNA adenine methylase
MQYLGGKSRLGKQIAYVINSIRKPGQPYWEPFCGSCWVTIHVRGEPRYCSDGCYELIEMWKALQNGWTPPRVVTEEMYQEAKAGKFDPALTAFIGFGCSFGGKWFAGYARSRPGTRWGKDHVTGCRASLLEKFIDLHGVRFFHSDYKDAPIHIDNALIYCDPPYAGTEGYDGVKLPFSIVEFWRHVRRWGNQGHTVIISEYAAPDDFTCVREMPTHTAIRTADNGREARTERLFMHTSQAHLYYANVPEQLEMGF